VGLTIILPLHAALRAANEKGSTAIWEITTHRSFALINQLFQEAGSDERIFSLVVVKR